MYRDLVEIFEEEYEKRRLITPQNTAEKMVVKGWHKQSEGEWKYDEDCECYVCSVCEHSALNNYRLLSTPSNFCPNCGAKMKGGEER